MGERTLAEVATAKRPSMVAGTEEEAFDNWIEVRGPRKVEKLMFQQAADNDFKADDTYNTKLAHPYFATVTTVSDTDASTDAAEISVDLTSDESNANFKQLTLRDAHSLNGIGVLITVYGM